MNAAAAHPKAEGDLVFVGDVHLDRDDPALPAFLGFLERIAPTTSRVVLLGDLFELWIGKPELEQPHQSAVMARLAELRRQGIVVRYLEGNRDYRIGPCYAGRALDEVAVDGLVERRDGRSLFAIHGDLANASDRRYRTWRRVSRSAPFWRLFHLLPARKRLRLARAMEERLRTTNLAFKRGFPEEAVRRYAAAFHRAGHDVVVLGHFHVERDLVATPPDPPGRIVVLPEWKGSRRHLRASKGRPLELVDSPA